MQFTKKLSPPVALTQSKLSHLKGYHLYLYLKLHHNKEIPKIAVPLGRKRTYEKHLKSLLQRAYINEDQHLYFIRSFCRVMNIEGLKGSKRSNLYPEDLFPFERFKAWAAASVIGSIYLSYFWKLRSLGKVRSTKTHVDMQHLPKLPYDPDTNRKVYNLLNKSLPTPKYKLTTMKNFNGLSYEKYRKLTGIPERTLKRWVKLAEKWGYLSVTQNYELFQAPVFVDGLFTSNGMHVKQYPNSLKLHIGLKTRKVK